MSGLTQADPADIPRSRATHSTATISPMMSGRSRRESRIASVSDLVGAARSMRSSLEHRAPNASRQVNKHQTRVAVGEMLVATKIAIGARESQMNAILSDRDFHAKAVCHRRLTEPYALARMRGPCLRVL